MPKFPNLARIVFVRLCFQIFSHKDHEDFFWCDVQKRVMYFAANVGRHLLKAYNSDSQPF